MTGTLAPDHTVDHTVTLVARDPRHTTGVWMVCGAIDDAVWSGTDPDERVKRIDRWCRDAGVDKRLARSLEFHLIRPGRPVVSVRPYGLEAQ